MPPRSQFLEFGTLPPARKRVVESGVSVIEMRAIGYQRRTFFGPWDITVGINIHEGTFKVGYNRSWKNGRNSYIEFAYVDRGMLQGFCPDDPWLNNRIYLGGLLDAGQFEILNMYTRDLGVIPGGKITRQITTLYREISDWKCWLDTKMVKRVKTQQEADAFELEYVVEPGERKRTKVLVGRIEPIETLMKTYPGNTWIRSPEYNEKMKPHFKELMVAATKGMEDTGNRVEAAAYNIIDDVSTMSEAEKARLAKMLFPNGAGAPIAAPVAATIDATAAVGEAIADEGAAGETAAADFTAGHTIDDLEWNELQKYAKGIGVNSFKLSKEDLISAIKIKMTSGDQDDANRKALESLPDSDVSRPNLASEEEVVDTGDPIT